MIYSPSRFSAKQTGALNTARIDGACHGAAIMARCLGFVKEVPRE
jgi:hypothetical protein